MSDQVTRRGFLKGLAVVAGSTALTGCAPKIVKETVVVEKPVEKIVKETVIVEGTPQVVEKVVTATPAPVTLTWWQYPLWTGVTGDETKGLSQDDPKLAEYTTMDWPNFIMGQFAEQYPGFNCKVEELTWAEGRTKLTMAASTGAGRPHLFLEDAPVIAKFAKKGAMVPVALSQEDKEDLFAGSVRAGSIGGTLWYRPWLGFSRFIVVNRAIFREAGVEDLIPTEGDHLWTYEQFLEAAKATSFTRSNGEEVYGYTQDFAHQAAHFWVDPFFWGYGGRIFDDDGITVVIDNPEVARGLQFVADMQNKHKVMPPGSAGLVQSDRQGMFWQSRVAMMMDSQSFAKKTQDCKEDGTIPNPDMVDVYPVMYPADLPNCKPGCMTGYMGFGQFDTGTEAERAACAKFCEFLTNRENTKAVKRASCPPARKSCGNIYEGDEFGLYATMALNYSHPDNVSPYFDAVNPILNAMWQAVLTEERTVKEALAEAQERCTEFIAEEEAKQLSS